MYDVIGDIHGHAGALERLLSTMDYQQRGGCWRHSDRQALFLGDFIDRGPAIPRVMEIVRSMVEQGEALAIMGNHELNAIGFHTPRPGIAQGWARERSIKNIRQYVRTLSQVDEQASLDDYIEWFRTLPMWLELDGLNVVHACWDPASMNVIRDQQRILGAGSEAFFQAAFDKEDSLFDAIETVVKGREIKLPEGVTYLDADKHERSKVRTRWWVTDREHWTWRDCALVFDREVRATLPDSEVDADDQAIGGPYPAHAPPVFFGHYWIPPEDGIQPLASNVACLDYSVARNGRLCAYRWNGEDALDRESFVSVEGDHVAARPNPKLVAER